jgi:hypothetical protein
MRIPILDSSIKNGLQTFIGCGPFIESEHQFRNSLFSQLFALKLREQRLRK